MTQNCPICHSKKQGLYKQIDEFPLHKCKSCGLIWVNKEISDETIAKFYSDSYYHNAEERTGYDDYLANEPLHRKNAISIIENTLPYIEVEKPRILEFGCAYGILLDEFKKHLPTSEVFGSEVSHDSAEYAIKEFGLNIQIADFKSANFEESSFDVIFLIGTIEHLTHPRLLVEKAKSLLKKGGVFVITTIDTEGFLPLYMLKPPEHLYYFNRKNLQLLVEQSGFKMTKRSLYFSNYFLHDLVSRVGKFSKIKPLGILSKIIRKGFPEIPLKIPTNEMIMFCVKN